METSRIERTEDVGAAVLAPAETPFEFNGNASAYFRIWIFNVPLTLLTLRIYSAWPRC